MSNKDSHWFTHDSNAASDPKIIALISVHDFSGYGRWWRLVELLRSEVGYRYNITTKFAFASLAKELNFNIEECKKFINDCLNDFELLSTDGTFIWSNSLNRRMEKWDSKKQVLSERGRKGAEVTNAKKTAQAKKQDGTSEETGRHKRELSGQNSGIDKIDKIDKEIEITNASATPEILSSNFTRPLTAPTLIQVKECFFQQGKPEKEAISFYEYYEGLNWHKGNTPIINWRSFANRWDVKPPPQSGIVQQAGITPGDQKLKALLGKK